MQQAFYTMSIGAALGAVALAIAPATDLQAKATHAVQHVSVEDTEFVSSYRSPRHFSRRDTDDAVIAPLSVAFDDEEVILLSSPVRERVRPAFLRATEPETLPVPRTTAVTTQAAAPAPQLSFPASSSDEVDLMFVPRPQSQAQTPQSNCSTPKTTYTAASSVYAVQGQRVQYRHPAQSGRGKARRVRWLWPSLSSQSRVQSSSCTQSCGL